MWGETQDVSGTYSTNHDVCVEMLFAIFNRVDELKEEDAEKVVAPDTTPLPPDLGDLHLPLGVEAGVLGPTEKEDDDDDSLAGVLDEHHHGDDLDLQDKVKDNVKEGGVEGRSAVAVEEKVEEEKEEAALREWGERAVRGEVVEVKVTDDQQPTTFSEQQVSVSSGRLQQSCMKWMLNTK
jgi:hypothetical protein